MGELTVSGGGFYCCRLRTRHGDDQSRAGGGTPPASPAPSIGESSPRLGRSGNVKEDNQGDVVGDFVETRRSSRSATTRKNASTTVGSYCVPEYFFNSALASSIVSRFR